MKPSSDSPRVVFAHGKESGPWGAKIQHLAGIAEACGFVVESPDYQGIDDPRERVAHLLEIKPAGRPLVLVGSSMGAYVSAMACAALAPDALLLMAPALYLTAIPVIPAIVRRTPWSSTAGMTISCPWMRASPSPGHAAPRSIWSLTGIG